MLSGDSAGWLCTVEPVKYDWSGGSYRITAGDDGLIPEEGQVYVRSNTTNEQAASEGKSEVDSTLPDLANTPGNGRYVEYTTEAASTAGYSHAWRIAVAMEVLIEPGDVTIYMGSSGYEGTVVSGGGNAEDSGFPEPGFLVTLPETLQKELEADGKDVTALKLQYKAGGQNVSAEWGFEKYGPGDHNVYRIKPIGQTSATKVMMTFTASDGTTVDSDEFDFDKYLYQELKMKVYGSGIEEGKVTVAYEGQEYAIATDTGTLTVRGAPAAPDAEQYGEIVVLNEAQTRDATGDALAQIAEGNSGAIVLPETFYTINGTYVQAQEGDEIALLFDSILETPENPNANTDLLIAKAEEILGDTVDEKVQYEARYLDLVDRTNGNAWVAASTPITVCWPLPEGTTGNTSFELLHFLGLHREMGSSTIASKIDTCTVERVPVTVTDTHVMFTIEPYQNENGSISVGFSPFVLAASRRPDRDQCRGGQRGGAGQGMELHRDPERYRGQRDVWRHDVCHRPARGHVLRRIGGGGGQRRLPHHLHGYDGPDSGRRCDYGGLCQSFGGGDGRKSGCSFDGRRKQDRPVGLAVRPVSRRVVPLVEIEEVPQWKLKPHGVSQIPGALTKSPDMLQWTQGGGHGAGKARKEGNTDAKW